MEKTTAATLRKWDNFISIWVIFVEELLELPANTREDHLNEKQSTSFPRRDLESNLNTISVERKLLAFGKTHSHIALARHSHSRPKPSANPQVCEPVQIAHANVIIIPVYFASKLKYANNKMYS